MSSHTPMPKVSTLEVIETGARRRRTLGEKQRIVAESFSVPRTAVMRAAFPVLTLGPAIQQSYAIPENSLSGASGN